jgi:uncharacterized protein
VLVDQIEALVKEKFNSFEGSHDWFHIERVYRMSKHLQKHEGGDKEVIKLSALLHDISDHKYNGGDFNAGGHKARQIIVNHGGSIRTADRVAQIVSEISFKGALVQEEMSSIELKIVRDADRLDAIGAIGIARAFAYGGSKARPLFNTEISPTLHSNKEEYLNSKSHTINHFHEKLLLLKGKLHTNTAKEIAEDRHEYMIGFLKQFHEEWNLITSS